ncbi:MAG TPA: hypothetical protein VH395_13415 [Jatrophihabitantaceae bacterium]|jgi:hypothetical protein
MSETKPWIVTGAVALVVAALAVLLAHTAAVRADNRHDAGRRYAPTAAQQAAVQAGATEAANLTSYRRTHFAADFARALAGTTGNLRKDLAAKKTMTLAAMTDGKFDLRSSVVQSAFESADHGKVLVLVTLNGRHVFDDNKQVSASVPQRLELTMIRAAGAWRAANLTSVGIS